MTDTTRLADYDIKYFGTNDHSFRGNFEDATTLIDLLPELFPEIFKNNRSSSIGINKLQEFVN